MIAVLHTFVCAAISVVVGRAVLNTGFVHILCKCAIRTGAQAVPCSIVCIIPIRTLVLALLGHIVPKLLTRAISNTRQRYPISIRAIQAQRTSSNTFSSHSLWKVVYTSNNLTHLHTKTNRSISGMLQGKISQGADWHTSPCCIVSI